MRYSFLPTIAKPFILLIIFFVGIFAGFLLPEMAQAQPYTSAQTQPTVTHPTAAEQGLVVVNAMLFEALSQMTCQLRGVEPIHAADGCLTINSTTGKVTIAETKDPSSFRPGGVLAFADQAINLASFQPGHTETNIKALAANFGIVKQAHAQTSIVTGQGFDSLNSLQSIFITARNTVYLLLVIAFILIGLGIMLRFNIDPRTVMTIQNQIPKVIIGIILITFSYAIAGALIDAMWVATYFGVNVLTQNVPNCTTDPSRTLTGSVTRGIIDNPISFTTGIFGRDTGCFGSFDGISGLAQDIGGTIGDRISEIIVESSFGLGDPNNQCISFSLTGGIHGDGGTCIRMVIFIFFKVLFGIAATIIAFIAIIASLFRLWFALIKSFILVLLDVIIAPVWIFFGLIPGATIGFGTWLRHLIAHLAVFPAAAMLLTISALLVRTPDTNPSQTVFVPPLIGNPNLALGINYLIAFGFILLIPELLNMIRDALKTSGSKYGGAVSAGLGAGIGTMISSAKGVGQVHMASREYVATDTGYVKRSRWNAVAGRLLGRG